ncbi:bifunctional folylpolyglutamate synthase/dihydrofolate synthase [Gracilibacillus oryzae]|uniref:tetrahydrofolate synthase n=1 Tax=Gracilibacillus oryzae TaxID=1672701 RepID=A0A7C8GT10_9BACI|nr:Mur ligase family protein [Gracilibacillus oryzae]KAB8134727.1 bifunctional folylpolyglutamate synthase/dihydrofolate synthase [Gracilibacillus oryzae]
MNTFDEVEAFFASRRKLGIKQGLERLDYLLEKTNHPEMQLKAVHLAGTNGKGSTLTYMKEVLIESGYKVGSFVSPGLPTIRDHMMINHQTISEEEFIAVLNDLLPLIVEMDQMDKAPSEYEILMVMTFLYFSGQTDIVLIETCMGGKEDVTNRIKPMITIITTVDYDHMGFLGSSLAEIAVHKAGIIKKQVPVVVGDLPQEALEVVLQKANSVNAPVYQYKKDYLVKDWQWKAKTQQFTFVHHKEIPVEISMLGSHQADNAANALMAMQLLIDDGWAIEQHALQKGMKQAKIHNRLEMIREEPAILIDGAHNTSSIKKLTDTIQTYWKDKRIFILFSAFKDKEIAKMTELLSRNCDRLVVTTFDHPRALSADNIADSFEFYSNYKDALKEITERMRQDDCLIITGSLHFVEEVKKHIQN